MNAPPAPESMRVSTICLLEQRLRGMEIEFWSIFAIVTEYISRQGETGVDPVLLFKNPPPQLLS